MKQDKRNFIEQELQCFNAFENKEVMEKQQREWEANISPESEQNEGVQIRNTTEENKKKHKKAGKNREKEKTTVSAVEQ